MATARVPSSMKPMLFLATLVALALSACAPRPEAAAIAAPPPAGAQEAVFAGGCFWCAEHDFAKIPGVVDVVSGYAGGDAPNPTYENHDGYVEAVRVTFDPARISYADLVERYWRLVDPTDPGGQFCDRGPAYETAIFVTPEQRAAAEASKARLTADPAAPKPIVTPILPYTTFYLAEGYHQDYADRNPVRYRYYRTGCGRDARIREVWGTKAN